MKLLFQTIAIADWKGVLAQMRGTIMTAVTIAILTTTTENLFQTKFNCHVFIENKWNWI